MKIKHYEVAVVGAGHAGVESALAYSLSFTDFIPARLVRGSLEGKKYVRMKNSL